MAFLASQPGFPNLAPVREAQTNPLQYPQSQDEWVARYDWLHNAYLGVPYTEQDHTNLRLFLAYDEAGKVIAETLRVTRDVQHVVDTDARAMAPSMMVLEQANDGTDALLSSAEAVWRRSRVIDLAPAWARWCASMGSVMFEAVNMRPTAPRMGTIVARDPRCVELEYDDSTQSRLERAIVRFDYFDEADIDPATGAVRQSAALHTYTRVLDDEEVNVWVDGVHQEAESGAHLLGVVPLVHVPFTPYTDPAHGLWSAHGLETAVAGADAIFAQVRAVGNRYGNPMLVVKGAKLGADSDVAQFGRTISGLPADGDAAYLEAQLSGISGLLGAMKEHRDTARETLPEFLFAGAGANLSAEALRVLTTSFRLKMEAVRRRWFSGLAQVTAMSVAQEERRAYDHEIAPLRIDASPVVPPDVSLELDNLAKGKALGVMTTTQLVEHAQRLGLVDATIDAATQAQEVEDRAADRATQFLTPGLPTVD